jgi:DNA-binding NarL/FixJ family response regulator
LSTTAVISPLPARLSNRPLALGGRVADRALAIVRGVVSASPAPDRELLRSLFGLTAAEAEIAPALVGGANRAAVAALWNSSLATVRTQVRAILEKTGHAGHARLPALQIS